MSFVVPRPYLFREIEAMSLSYDSIVACKLDNHYYRNWSIWLDSTIIYEAIKSLVYGKKIIIILLIYICY